MESRFSSESRSWESSYPSYGYNYRSSSESRSSESRGESISYPQSYQRKEVAEQSEINVESIDALISKLEIAAPKSNSKKVQDAYNERHSKIEELKKLREELVTKTAEEEELRQLNNVNAELDIMIKALRNKLK